MALVIHVWKIFLALFAIILFMFITSSIICGSNAECRYHIPTVSNMLNSTIATPFLVSGFNVAVGFHFLTILCLYCMTVAYAYYWSMLQVFFGIIVYATLVITLFIIPFTGWEHNWANVSTLAALVLWMVFAQISIKRGLRLQAFKQTIVPFIIFCCCVLVYIIVRAVDSAGLPENGRDIGIMVCEIVGALSFIVFMLMCIWQVRELGIQVITPPPGTGGSGGDVYSKFEVGNPED